MSHIFSCHEFWDVVGDSVGRGVRLRAWPPLYKLALATPFAKPVRANGREEWDSAHAVVLSIACELYHRTPRQPAGLVRSRVWRRQHREILEGTARDAARRAMIIVS